MNEIVAPDQDFPHLSHALLHGIAALVFVIISLCFLKNFLNLTLGQSALVAFVSGAGALILGFITYQHQSAYQAEGLHIDPELMYSVSVSRGLLVFFAIPFLVRFYLLCASPSEKWPQAFRDRGWLRILDWAYVLFISLAADFGSVLPFQYIFPALALLLLLPRFIAAFMNTTPTSSHAAASSPADNRSAERAKILSLLEQGKITVEESADLLAALGAAKSPHQPTPARYPIGPRLTLMGAALIVAGFFLPWFSINPMQEMQKLAGQFPFMMSGVENIQGSPMPSTFPQGVIIRTIDVTGPKIGKGLGWMILFLGLAAAAIPFCFTSQRQGLFSIVPLTVGIFMLLYLCSEAARSISFGFVMVSLGYLLEAVGRWKWKAAA